MYVDIAFQPVVLILPIVNDARFGVLDCFPAGELFMEALETHIPTLSCSSIISFSAVDDGSHRLLRSRRCCEQQNCWDLSFSMFEVRHFR